MILRTDFKRAENSNDAKEEDKLVALKNSPHVYKVIIYNKAEDQKRYVEKDQPHGLIKSIIKGRSKHKQDSNREEGNPCVFKIKRNGTCVDDRDQYIYLF